MLWQPRVIELGMERQASMEKRRRKEELMFCRRSVWVDRLSSNLSKSLKLCCKTHPHGTSSSPLYTSPAKAVLASHFRVHQIKSCMHVLPCYKWIRSYLPLWTLTYLHSVSHALLFFRFPHAQNPTIQMQDYFGPYVWNSLPQDIRQCSTLPSFKTKLKTSPFSQYFRSS